MITDVPAATPVVTPLDASMVAMLAEPLLQVPPDTELPKVVVDPAHTVRVPVMDDKDGSGLTVNDCCAVFVPPHPPVFVYMMLQVPAAAAVTRPEDEFTVATPVFELDQTPPDVISYRLEVFPIQIVVIPVIVAGADGNGLRTIIALPVIGTEVTGNSVTADTV